MAKISNRNTCAPARRHSSKSALTGDLSMPSLRIGIRAPQARQVDLVRFSEQGDQVVRFCEFVNTEGQ